MNLSVDQACPKVSIVVGCYNQRDYVREAMDSALGQTYGNIEVVATDNGSSDGTQDLLRGYAGDKRVKLLFREKNSNMSKLANEAIALSAGDFISFLCGDDYYLPHKIERQMACFSKLSPDYGVVYAPNYVLNTLSGKQWLDPCLRASGAILQDMLLRYHAEGGISIMAPVLRRECCLRFPFREEFFVEGEAAFFRMATSYKFHFLDEPLGVMRNHLNNQGKAIKDNRDLGIRIFEKLGQEAYFPGELRWALYRFMGRTLRNYGWQGVRVVQNPSWARECFRLALRYDPCQIFHPRTLTGLSLSVLPPNLLASLNNVANRLINHNENIAFKKDYS